MTSLAERIGLPNSSSRNRVMYAVAAGLVLVALAVPVTAFVIVPQFVRSTVNERAPQAAAATVGSAGSTSVTPIPQTAPSQTLATGALRQINAVDFGKGNVQVIKTGDKRFVRFENVEISAAPAQHVYLSDRTDGKPGNFIDLGELKATNGSFNYEIPSTVDLGKVRSVVSFCKQFNVTITFALLQFT